MYFVDDMNMPFVDKYDTQSAIELMRQSVDYKGWFDKVGLPSCVVIQPINIPALPADNHCLLRLIVSRLTQQDQH